MDYKKPQSTLVQGGAGIYPLTTADQVILADGSRLEKDGKISADSAANSAKLGGKSLAEIMLDLYPVGAVYISVNSTSPASLFGGTWEQLQDRFLLAAGSTYSAGSTGGEETHTLTVKEMPTHRHSSVKVAENYLTAWASENSGNSNGFELSNLFKQNLNDDMNKFAGDYSGGGAAHNNMPPYLAVYMWKRVS